jgi:NADH-quinone oxidoreductase subunit I
MKITTVHLFAKNVTVQYPDERLPVPDNARNRLYVDMADCNGCNGCVRACPVNCITVETVKVVPGDEIPPLKSGGKRGLWVTKYEIDFAKCCFCALCTEACPTNAIRTTKEYEYSTYSRNDLIYNFIELQNFMTPEQIKEKKDMFVKFQAEKKREEAAKKAQEAKGE